jgi:hypothetical protein
MKQPKTKYGKLYKYRDRNKKKNNCKTCKEKCSCFDLLDATRPDLLTEYWCREWK